MKRSGRSAPANRNSAITEPKLRIALDPVGKGIEPTESVVEYRIRRDQSDASERVSKMIGGL